MIRRIAVLTVVLAVAAPATTQAHPAHTSDRHHKKHRANSNPITIALQRAEEYWSHPLPCSGQISVRDEEAALSRGMWTTWETPLGPTIQTGEPASFTDCVVHLNTAFWPSWYVDDLNFHAFCQGITHELGHLLGISDADGAPGTVEQPEALRAPLVPQCRDYRLRYGHEWLTGQ